LDSHVDLDEKNLRVAKLLYEARRRRDAAASIKGLFGEPGWDILLDLFIARKTRTTLQVSSVCAGAGVPSTTILRWIARLEHEGLISRTADQDDARRRFVSLTSKGLKLTTELLEAIGPLDA
jgi:MarR family transcriptional regulator, temperature-dependent positive regulator of motility